MEQYKYNIIGQTFNYNETTGDEKGYFAIRENKDSKHFHNLDILEGEPVLPSFGCADIMELLSNIYSIQTAEQAVQMQ